MREGDERELLSEDVDKIRNVKSPEKGAEAATFSEAFEDLDICGRGIVAMEDPYFNGVM